MRKSVKIITGFLLTAILSAAAVFASFSDRLDVVNHIFRGRCQYIYFGICQEGKGRGKVYAAIGGVPGQTISKIPRIKKQMHFPAGSGPESHIPGKTENWNA